METIIFAVLLIFFLAGIFLTWFFIHKAKSKERLMLIDKGIDLSALSRSDSQKTNFHFPWLKIGIVITSISIGLLVSTFLMVIPFFENVAAGQLPLLFIFLFGGIGMILAYVIDKPRKQD